MKLNILKLTLIGLTVGLLTTLVFISGCGSEIDRSYALKGDPGPQGEKGDPGADGQDGVDGTNGTNGHNSLLSLTRGTVSSAVCTSLNALLVKSGVDSNDNNVLENSEVNAASFVCDGQTGPQGPQGPAGPTGTYQIISIIDPCGDASGIYDEVLLKLANGTIIASFSDNANGNNTRFSLIPAGSYVTTDGSNCHFSVDGSGNVSW